MESQNVYTPRISTGILNGERLYCFYRISKYKIRFLNTYLPQRSSIAKCMRPYRVVLGSSRRTFKIFVLIIIFVKV